MDHLPEVDSAECEVEGRDIADLECVANEAPPLRDGSWKLALVGESEFSRQPSFGKDEVQNVDLPAVG